MPLKGKRLTKKARQLLSQSKKTDIVDLVALVEKGNQYIAQLTDSQMPTISGLALFLDVSKSSLEYRLYQAPDDDIVKQFLIKIKTMQEEYLLTRAVTNKANANFAQFLLTKAHTGYEEKPPHLTQNNNFQISPDILADALALMDKKKPGD